MHCQATFHAVKAWSDKELSGQCAVFRGKAAATNMAEAPVQMVRTAILHALDVCPKEAKEKGYRTNWPDQEKQCSITHNKTFLARGKLQIEELQMSIELENKAHNKANDIMCAIVKANREGRDKSIVSLAITPCSLSSEVWGRAPKQRQAVGGEWPVKGLFEGGRLLME